MKTRAALQVILFVLLSLAAGGCGVLVDYARDNELSLGPLNSPSYLSPVRLRVGVAPFKDEVGLGSPEAGRNLARLLSEELAQDSNLEVAPADEVAAALAARAFEGPLTPALAAEICAGLRLNALVLGTVSEVNQYNRRKGWRRLARLFTSQREYVDAVLAVVAVDAATGIVLVSRASVGEYDGGAGGPQIFGDENVVEGPSQEALETSLDAALAEAAHRTRAGLADLPFKARVTADEGGLAVIPFGDDVGLAGGQEFVRLEVHRTITNTIGETYQIMGAASARLKAAEVGETSARLEIIEGWVQPGDIVQAVR